MTRTNRSFSINGTTLIPMEIDIRDLDADAYVVPVGTNLGNELKLFDRAEWVVSDTGCETVVMEALNPHLPFKLGDVAITPAGNLKAKYLIHAAIIDWENLDSPDQLISNEVISLAAARCIDLASALGIQSIAFTPWGPKVACENGARITAFMLQAITTQLQQSFSELRTVYLVSNIFEHYQWLLDRTFVFHLIHVHVKRVRDEVKQLDLPEHRSKQIFSVLDELQNNIVVCNEIVGGDKIVVDQIANSSDIAIGKDVDLATHAPQN